MAGCISWCDARLGAGSAYWNQAGVMPGPGRPEGFPVGLRVFRLARLLSGVFRLARLLSWVSRLSVIQTGRSGRFVAVLEAPGCFCTVVVREVVVGPGSMY